MKLPMILVLVLGNAIALAAQDTANNMRQNPSPIQEKTKRLELSITTDRQRYKRDGKITITAVITNGEYITDLIVLAGSAGVITRALVCFYAMPQESRYYPRSSRMS